MNNLNLSQNSNYFNDSPKTQEKLYSNDISLDDILTYSDDNSQNQSYNKSLSKQNISNKDEKQKQKEVKTQVPIISSFNSEIAMSFLNSEKEKANNNIKNKENKYSKSASKPLIVKEELYFNDYKKILNKSYNNICKHLNLLDFNDPFEENIGINFKDVSGFHASISNIFSEFEIKDISISKSNNEIKKNNSEKDNIKLNNLETNNNKVQISEEHSNTNSMCNYQNNSNLNDISNNNNKNLNKNLDKEKTAHDIFSPDEIGDINIKMNISLSNCDNNKNKFNSDKKNYIDEILDEKEINKKYNYTTSNKKESNSFYAQNTKHSKNIIKYTKAQCVQALFQNNTNIENKQYILSDAPIKTKDTTSDKKNTKKLISLSPHKLSFEIQKNDCIQISYKNNKNKSNIMNQDLNNNITSINYNSELSISKVEEIDKNNNNLFYNDKILKQYNTTSFMISPNINIKNKFIHKKISYQKNNNIRNKKIFINNRNINIQKDDSNNFFYNPNHPLASGPIFSNISCNNKNIQNELHTPDLNKNKITPMTCVHKGSLIYYNEINNGEANNTIKYNYSINASHLPKKNKIVNDNNYIDKNKKSQKKLVYLKNNASKNNRMNKNNKEKIESSSRIKQETIINNKNNSYIKISHNENNNKIQGKRKISKINGKQLINKKKIFEISNNNNSKINNSFQKNLTIKHSINNNNSIYTNNTKRIIRGANKIKIKSNSNSIINKINNQIIKESSLFHILYNMPARNANTTKNNSGISSKDEKESTIIQKNTSREKEKENSKKSQQKKLIKHNTNNSFSLYNSFFDKIMDDSKKKNNNKVLSKDKNKNKSALKKNMINQHGNKSHKKIKSEINLDSLTSNFNFNNIVKRRKNNKSLYNFGNIFFINQNHIIKDEIEPNNSNIIKFINKNIRIKSKNKENINDMNKEEKNKSKKKDKNKLIFSIKQNPKIINDFSKYRKKKDINMKDKNRANTKRLYNKQEYKETQLISEN